MKYSNGVEARVGDVFRFQEASNEQHVMTKLLLALYEKLDASKEFSMHIELMRRPFQVGDPVIAVGGGEKACVVIGEETDRIKNSLGIKDIHLCDSCVHANPLWRDHPDYVKVRNENV